MIEILSDVAKELVARDAAEAKSGLHGGYCVNTGDGSNWDVKTMADALDAVAFEILMKGKALCVVTAAPKNPK